MNRKSVSFQRYLRISCQVLLAILLLVGYAPSGGRPATLPQAPIQAEPVAAAPLQALSDAAPTVSIPEPSVVEIAGKTELVEKRTANSATFDLGNGEYMLVQDTQPMHYQDAAGNWQRIAPAFVAATGGWTNNANALKTGVAARSARANLALAQTGVGWEPRSLEVTNAAGQATPWATVLAETQAVTGALSADARTVTYPASWSDPALQDRWESGYGQAEYSLRIERPPLSPPQFGGGK